MTMATLTRKIKCLTLAALSLILLWQLININFSETTEKHLNDMSVIKISAEYREYLDDDSEINQSDDPVLEEPNVNSVNDLFGEDTGILTNDLKINHAEEITSLYPEESGMCLCGFFNSTTPTDEDRPIITKAMFNVECNIYGEGDCAHICPMLVLTAKDKVPELLCATVGDSKNFQVSIHSRVCTFGRWIYSDYVLPNEICCRNNKVVDCKQEEQNPHQIKYHPPSN